MAKPFSFGYAMKLSYNERMQLIANMKMIVMAAIPSALNVAFSYAQTKHLHLHNPKVPFPHSDIYTWRLLIHVNEHFVTWKSPEAVLEHLYVTLEKLVYPDQIELDFDSKGLTGIGGDQIIMDDPVAKPLDKPIKATVFDEPDGPPSWPEYKIEITSFGDATNQYVKGLPAPAAEAAMVEQLMAALSPAQGKFEGYWDDQADVAMDIGTAGGDVQVEVRVVDLPGKGPNGEEFSLVYPHHPDPLSGKCYFWWPVMLVKAEVKFSYADQKLKTMSFRPFQYEFVNNPSGPFKTINIARASAIMAGYVPFEKHGTFITLT